MSAHALKLGQWLCVPRFHVVCPYPSDGAARARGAGESKRCARDQPIEAAAEMGLRESVCSEKPRVGLTYPAEKSGAVSPPSLPCGPRPLGAYSGDPGGGGSGYGALPIL